MPAMREGVGIELDTIWAPAQHESIPRKLARMFAVYA